MESKLKKKVMTLKRVKEMNIPIGTPLELTFKHEGSRTKVCKSLGYLYEIDETIPERVGTIIYDSHLNENEKVIPVACPINCIIGIKVLEYKKQ